MPERTDSYEAIRVLSKRTRMKHVFLLISLLLAGAASAATPATLIVQGAAFSAETRNTLGELTASHLREQGFLVTVQPTVGEPANPASGARLFRLVLGELGKKILVKLEELAPGTSAATSSAHLFASSIEDVDALIPRLASSVLTGAAVQETATVETVSADEARTNQLRKSGRGSATIGIPMSLVGGGSAVGVTFGYLYESSGARFGFDLGGNWGSTGGMLWLSMLGHWVPLSGSWSPYVGGGAGLLSLWKNVTTGDPYYGYSTSGGVGAGAKLEAGVQLMRLNSVRMEVGAQLYLPFFQLADPYGSSTGDYAAVPALSMRILF